MKGKLPDDKVNAIISLVEKKGLSLKEIAKAAGVSKNSVVRYKKKYRIMQNNFEDYGRKLPENKINRIVELSNQGLNVNEICKQMDVSRGTVINYRRQNRARIKNIGFVKSTLPQDKINEIVYLAKAGLSEKEIVVKAGVGIRSVKKYKLLHGIMDPPKVKAKSKQLKKNQIIDKFRIQGYNNHPTTLVTLPDREFSLKDMAKAYTIVNPIVTNYDEKFHPIFFNDKQGKSITLNNNQNKLITEPDKEFSLEDMVSTTNILNPIDNNYEENIKLTTNNESSYDELKFLKNKVDMIVTLMDKGLDLSSIAKIAGVSKTLVNKYKQEHRPISTIEEFINTKLSEAKINMLMHLLDQGYNLPSISKTTKQPAKSTITKKVKKKNPTILTDQKQDTMNLPKDKIDMIIKLVDEGQKIRDIASQVGVAISSVSKYKKIYRPDAIHTENGKRIISKEKIDMIFKLINEGKTRKYVVQTVGIAKGTFDKYKKKYLEMSNNNTQHE